MIAATTSPQPDAAALPKQRKRRVPSERNRHVFVEVVIRGREQPEVARELGITQQRVSQIIEQFYGWLAENVPPQAEGMNAEERLLLAANLTYLRLEHAQTEAERTYRQSTDETESVKIRYSAKGDELDRVITYKTPRGKGSFLNAAIRACKQKWAVVRMFPGILSRGMGVEQLLVEGRERQAGMPAPPKKRAQRRTRPVKAAQSPAPRGAGKVLCGSPPSSPPAASLASTPAAATSVATPACVPAARRKPTRSAARRRFFKPCTDAATEGLSDRSNRPPAVGPRPALVQVVHPNHDLNGRSANS